MGNGVFITLFFLYTQFNESKSDIRQQFYSGFENMQAFILQTGTTLRSIQFMTEQHEERLENEPNYVTLPATGSYSLYPLSPEADCTYFKNRTSDYLNAFEQLIYFWKDSIAAPQGLNHVFVIGSKSYCMMDFPIRTTVSDIEILKKVGYENIRSYQSLRLQGQERNLYTIVHGAQTDSGQLYLIQPIYVSSLLYGFIGLERTISLNQFIQRSNKSFEVVVLNSYNQPVLYYPTDLNPKIPIYSLFLSLVFLALAPIIQN